MGNHNNTDVFKRKTISFINKTTCLFFLTNFRFIGIKRRGSYNDMTRRGFYLPRLDSYAGFQIIPI